MVISSLEEHYLRAGSACQMTLTIPQTGRTGIKTKHPPISFDLTLPTSVAAKKFSLSFFVPLTDDGTF
jgi:hypothetical protein